jgi:exonuclease III
MAGSTTYISLLTLNVNGFNSSIERCHFANWIKKEDPTICLQETNFVDSNKQWLRVKGWKKTYHGNGT